MKKEYITPEMKIINLCPNDIYTDIFATSVPIDGGSGKFDAPIRNWGGWSDYED